MSVETLERLKYLRELRQLKGKTRVEQWWDDPAKWVEDVIPGLELADYQRHELQTLGRNKRVAVRGPRGSGKTMPAALVVLWFAYTREMAGVDWKIPVTAGGWQQLNRFTWPEIHKWERRINYQALGMERPNTTTQLLRQRITLNHGEAFAVNSDSPDRIEGAHASNLLLVIDEGKIVPDASWDAMEGYFSNPGDHYIFAISTPGAAVGRFYEIHAQQAGYEDWTPIHVTIDQSIQSGRITEEWKDQRLRQWGETSQAYQCHVLAEFAGEEDGVIPLAWIEAAMNRWTELSEADELKTHPHRIGVDVAGSVGGGDKHVIALRDGWHIYQLDVFDSGDTVLLAERVQQRAARNTEVVIDAIGVGDGTTAVLKRDSTIRVLPFIASQKSGRRDSTGSFGFTNKRSAAWWNMRELLDPTTGEEIALPPVPELLGDLTAPRWREAAGGKIQIESKDDIRRRIGRSTDYADAVIMAFYEERGRTRGVLNLNPQG